MLIGEILFIEKHTSLPDATLQASRLLPLPNRIRQPSKLSPISPISSYDSRPRVVCKIRGFKFFVVKNDDGWFFTDDLVSCLLWA